MFVFLLYLQLVFTVVVQLVKDIPLGKFISDRHILPSHKSTIPRFRVKVADSIRSGPICLSHGFIKLDSHPMTANPIRYVADKDHDTSSSAGLHFTSQTDVRDMRHRIGSKFNRRFFFRRRSVY